MIYSITIPATAKNKKRFPGCLAHAVIGMFYSVLANQRNPNIHIVFYSVGANRDQLFVIHIFLRGVRRGGTF